MLWYRLCQREGYLSDTSISDRSCWKLVLRSCRARERALKTNWKVQGNWFYLMGSVYCRKMATWFKQVVAKSWSLVSHLFAGGDGKAAEGLMRLCPSCKTFFLLNDWLFWDWICLLFYCIDFSKRCLYINHPLIVTISFTDKGSFPCSLHTPAKENAFFLIVLIVISVPAYYEW